MKYKKYIIINILVFCIGLYTCIDVNTEQNNIEEIINNLYSIEKTIKSGIGNMSSIIARKDTTSDYFQKQKQSTTSVIMKKIETNYFFAFNSQKKRLDYSTNSESFSGNLFSFGDKQLYDGIEYKSLRLAQAPETELFEIQGIVSQTPKFNMDFDPRLYGIPPGYSREIKFEGNLPSFPEFIEKALQNIKITTVKINNESTCCIKGDFIDDKTKMKIYLSINNEYLPVLIEINNDIEKIEIRQKYKKYNNEIFFPKKIVSEHYRYDNSGILILSYTNELEVDDDFKINNSVKENYFDLEFPNGLNVINLN